MPSILIADSGSSKTQWCLLTENKKKMINTQGISPYFLNYESLGKILSEELLPKTGSLNIDEIYYYVTGCSNAANISLIKRGLKKLYKNAAIKVEHDLLALITKEVELLHSQGLLSPKVTKIEEAA